MPSALRIFSLVAALFAAVLAPHASSAEPTREPLPVFFFHGVTANSTYGHNFGTNLTAEGRLYTALNFCEDLCSISGLAIQVQQAIAQIRSITTNDKRYDNGYVFISHSQGALIARAVVHEMDDHKVKMFVSMAGAINGLFNGPQPSDIVGMEMFINIIGPQLIPAQYFDFTKYTPLDYYGKAQRDFVELSIAHPELYKMLSVFDMDRMPVFNEWVRSNTFMPKVNNVNVCADGDAFCVSEKVRRRANFLKVESAHFFGSPLDDVISPWQASVLQQYSEVDTLDQIETEFFSFRILKVNETREYINDTYGLRTLDERGDLHFHVVENVGHSCWINDYVALGSSFLCEWIPLYDTHLFPVLQDPACFAKQ